MQSTALYLMSSMRQFERADVAIFADPCAEHEDTYKVLDWLLEWSKQCADAVPIEVVKTNIKDDVLNGVNARGSSFVSLPTFTINEQGEMGMVRHRQCTGDYKITPIYKKVRELYGLKPRQRLPKTEMWLGISMDEYSRMKPNKHTKITNRFPLIEMEMSRTDCKRFFEDNGFITPVKSACVFCPFHSDKMWIDLKKENGQAWELVKEVDKSLRERINNGMRNQQYLHSSCKPIDEVIFKHEDQIDMFDNECEGHCGL